MAKWKQIWGDVNWDKYGCLLAKVDPSSRSVDLVRIEPWLEYDSSAIRTHGLWFVDEGTIDYEDMGTDREDVQGAIRSNGIDENEYKKFPPEGKAQVIASYQGLGGDSRSVSDLRKALPDKPENITFWHGKETEESIQALNQEMRMEALDKIFDTSGRFPDQPEMDALEFMLGDDEWEFKLDDNAMAGLGYAQIFGAPAVDLDKKHNKLTIRSPKEFAALVKSLSEAPAADNLKASHHALARYLGWTGPGPVRTPDEARDDDRSDSEALDDAANELAESAHEAAENLLSEIGFSWHF
jgi:hypothetical protein